jgi:phosphatidylglycerol:prolipoprotein diacylglycerol transferase
MTDPNDPYVDQFLETERLPYYAISIPFDPNISVGPITLAWHAIFAALGILLGYWIARRYAPSAGVSVEDVDAIAVWGILGGIIGARVVFVIDNWELFDDRPLRIIQVWSGGMAVWGGILGGVSGGVISGFMARLQIPAMADLGGMGLILGQGVGRIGDLINGEHHGLATDLPWAFKYTNPNTLAARDGLGNTFPEHPVSTYELLFDFVILGLLIYLIRRWGGTGRVFWIYLSLYSLGRFLVSFLRVDPMMGPLQLAQWLGLASIALAAIVLVPSFMKKGIAGR